MGDGPPVTRPRTCQGTRTYTPVWGGPRGDHLMVKGRGRWGGWHTGLCDARCWVTGVPQGGHPGRKQSVCRERAFSLWKPSDRETGCWELGPVDTGYEPAGVVQAWGRPYHTRSSTASEEPSDIAAPPSQPHSTRTGAGRSHTFEPTKTRRLLAHRGVRIWVQRGACPVRAVKLPRHCFAHACGKLALNARRTLIRVPTLAAPGIAWWVHAHPTPRSSIMNNK